MERAINTVNRADPEPGHTPASNEGTTLDDYDEIPAIAAQLCGTEGAVLFFNTNRFIWAGRLPAYNQLNQTAHEMEMGHNPASTPAFCAPNNAGNYSNTHAIVEEGAINAYISGAVSLTNAAGEWAGYLAVYNEHNTPLTTSQQMALVKLAKQTSRTVALNEAVRKLAEQKATLEIQKTFFEEILNNLPTDIAVFDANHRYLFVNPGAIKGAEYRKYIIGKDDFEYCAYRNRDISLAQLRRDRFLEIKSTRKEIRWEDTVNDPEGNPNTSLRRLFPVFDENGALKIVIGFGLDITDRKLLEIKQAAFVEQLSIQNEQLVDFCNIVSHNLRAPLVNMSMLVEYINETKDEEERKELTEQLRPVINQLHNTFNELVESIQIRQKSDIVLERIDMAECLAQVTRELKSEIDQLDAHIEADFTNCPVIRYNYKYLYSIFYNLLSNSLKYHSPQREPVITINTTLKNDTLVLAVADNGLGIDLNLHQANMFKIGKVFHRHPKAKGFGLFITKAQVEAMQGKIWVESTVNVGTTFFVEFKINEL